MAEDIKVIAATVKVDTGAASTNVKDLNKNLKDVKTSLKETGATATATGKEIGVTGGHFSNIKSQIGALPGPLGAAGKGVQGLGAAFKALLANPVALVIVGIVLALKGLYNAFVSTAGGADKAEQIFSGISAVLEVVSNRVAKFAEAIVAFFSGDFGEAADLAKEAFSGIGDDIAKEFNSAKKGTEILQEVEDKTRDLTKSRALLNKNLAESKELLSDENASLKEKAAALDIVKKAEQAQTDQELANEKKKLEGIKLTKGSRDLSDEDLDEITEQENKVTEIEQRSAEQRRTFNKQDKVINREARAKEKEERQAVIEQQKQEQQKLFEFTQKLTSLKQDNQLRAIKDEAERDRQALENKIAAEKQGIARQLQEKKITRTQFDQLNAAADINADLQRTALTDKQNEEKAKKEADFQKEINTLTNKLKLSGLTDARQAEKLQLEIEAEEKIKEAAAQYKNDQTKFLEVKKLIDDQLAQDQAKLDKKNAKEDLDKNLKPDDTIKNTDFEARKAELDADVLQLKDAFDRKIISELEYNTKVKELSEERKRLDQGEVDTKLKSYELIGRGLDALGSLFGKQTAAAKVAAIASAVLNTYMAAWAIFRNAALNPKSILFPAQPYIEAGIAIVAGLNNVKQIAKVQAPGGGGGVSMSSGSSSAPTAPLAPTQSSTKIDNSSIGDAAYGGVNRNGIRAYVVEQDSAEARKRAERLATASILGG